MNYLFCLTTQVSKLHTQAPIPGTAIKLSEVHPSTIQIFTLETVRLKPFIINLQNRRKFQLKTDHNKHTGTLITKKCMRKKQSAFSSLFQLYS